MRHTIKDEASTEVHPFVADSLARHSTVLPLSKWMEAVFHLPEDALVARMAEIKHLNWFADLVVQSALFDYAQARRKNRHGPFVALVSRVVELARGRIKGIRKNKSYPVDDLTFVEYAYGLVPIRLEAGFVGAERKPGILCMRRESAERLKAAADDIGAEWPDILFCWKLKYNRYLTNELKKERVSRGLSDLRSGERPPLLEYLLQEKVNTQGQD